MKDINYTKQYQIFTKRSTNQPNQYFKNEYYYE
jgi:hypothetical protein